MASPFILKVKEYYTQNNKIVKSGASIKIGGTVYSARQFKKHLASEELLIADHVGKVTFYGKVEEIQAQNRHNTMDKILENLADAVFNTIHGELSKHAKDTITGDTQLASHGYSYAGKLPIMDRKSNLYLMFDNVRKCIDKGTTFSTWEKFTSKQPKEVKEVMNAAVTVAEVVYDPFSTLKAELREVNGQKDVLTINAHDMPTWREIEIEEPKLPELFEKFIGHLFDNDADSIEYVYNWLYYMIMDRNHVMLLIHGGRGVGKGSLLSIIKELVGRENFGEMPSGFFTSRFNGELKYKRVCAFDEFPVERQFINEWKLLPEPYMAVEDKGADVLTYNNYASYIVTNNTEAEVSILGDERKFSVPKCKTEGALDVYLGAEVWEDFMQEVLSDNSPMLANIGWWLIKNGKSNRFDNRRPFKSDTFYEIVEKALTNWQRGIINEIERRETPEINLAHIEEITRGTGRTKIEKFLNVHRDREGNLYGYVKQLKGGDRVIVPSEYYMPKEVIEATSTAQEEPLDLSTLNF